LLAKPVLNGDILSFNPAKLVQLLPERIDENRHTRRSAIIQETDAKDFSRLLRVGGNAKREEQSAKGKANASFKHGGFPFSHSLLFAPCTLRFFTELPYPPAPTPPAQSSRRSASRSLD
jgi:hypothetical protein